MYELIIILILIVAVLLGLVVLIQNPKGGGINSSLSGVSNQVFGAKKSTDIVEKATWYLALTVFVLSLVSVWSMNLGTSEEGVIQESKAEQIPDEIPTTPINPLGN